MASARKNVSQCHCINIRRAANLVSGLYDRHLEPVGLTISQYSLLANLDVLSTASISKLAGQVGLDRTTLVRNLKPLMERGLIEDLSHPGQRSRILKLTQPGRALLMQGRLLWSEAQRELEEKIGSQNTQFFKTLMEQLQQ